MANEARARADADSKLAASIEGLRQNSIGIDEEGNIWGVGPVTRPTPPPPTRAEFDALLARLAAAEAEIAKLKMGRGPEAEGVL